MSRTTEVFFLVDGARLEAQTCLLAPSLKAHLTASQKPVAYLREDYAPNLHPMTRDILRDCGVETRLIPGTDQTHAPWTAPYPQGNKILAAATPRDCDVSVFIDTDTVLARPIDFAAELGTAQIAASVSDYSSPATDDDSWRSHYALFGLDLPEKRVQLRAGRRLWMAPYYNAGVVLFAERGPDGQPTGIGPAWLEMARDFDHRQDIPYERAFIDQLTLPILGQQIGAPVKDLDQRLNFNIQSFGDSAPDMADIVHYHNIGVLWAHQDHGAAALQLLLDMIGPDGIRAYAETFRPHIKRRRLKRLLEPLGITL